MRRGEGVNRRMKDKGWKAKSIGDIIRINDLEITDRAEYLWTN